MPQGYEGLPDYYLKSSNPITPNLGLSLKGMDAIVAEDFVLIDTAIGGGGMAIQVNGAVIPSANFIDSGTVTFTVLGSNVSAHAAASATLPVTIAAVPSNWLNSYSSVTGLFTETQPTFTDLAAHPTTLGGYGITDAIAAGVMTTLGDMLYENITPTPTKLSGNITATKMYLSQTGTGVVSAAPAWAQINYSDITGTAPVTAWAALTGVLTNGQVIPYGDAGISRTSAGILGIGNGTQGNTSGGLNLQTLAANAGNATGVVIIGAYPGVAADGGIWVGSSVTTTNYRFLGTATETIFNGLSGHEVTFAIANGDIAHLDSIAFKLNSGIIFGWVPLTTGSGQSLDTGISRLGAASLAIGNGSAANTTGNLSLNRLSKAGADFAGQATVTAGGTTKAVSFAANYAGAGQPVIILTPTSDPLALGVPVGYWVTYSGGAGAWTGFTVNIQTALAGDVVFNYIVIGVA